MPQFDSKTFNAEVFGKYVERIPNLTRNELIKSRALVVDNGLKALFPSQTGSFKATTPFFGKIGKSTVNYDGSTDIVSTSTETYSQTHIVIGRADAWTEKDFSADITGGVNFMDNVAQQIGEYWDEVDTNTLNKVLDGVFSMTSNQDFITKHTYSIATDFDVTTLNTAIQKALGDNKSKFALAIMHSAVATSLENKQLLNYLKYTDKNGVTRDLTIATLNGRVVIVDDGVPTKDTYKLTTDTALDASKTYYTRSGSAGAYTYTAVASPNASNIGSYYEFDGIEYTTYVFGEGAIKYCDVGAEVPYEMSRDAKTNGGQTTLYSRKRKIFSPVGISFVGSIASTSPTDAELANGANWEIVNNGKTGASKRYIDHKAIAICRILSKG